VPLTETLRGAGKVFKGQQFIADVHYELQIHSHYNTTRTMEGEGRYLAGKTVQLRISPSSAITEHFGVERLTLYMSDGRKQDFFVATSEGDCTGTGGPYQG
jgi:hypothetical protein